MRFHEAVCKNITPRIEYKYFVPIQAQTQLINDLRSFMREDDYTFGKSEGYTVASVYFDNHAFQCYHDKLDGLQDRFKMRIRFYPSNTSSCFYRLEFKFKVDDRIVKGQTELPEQLLDELLSGNFDNIPYADTPEFSYLYRMVKINHFMPIVRIDYKREAFFANNDKNIRVTLDREVKARRFLPELSCCPHIPVFPKNQSILEIKSPSYFPFWLNTIVRKYNLSREAISKYATALQKVAINSTLFIK